MDPFPVHRAHLEVVHPLIPRVHLVSQHLREDHHLLPRAAPRGDSARGRIAFAAPNCTNHRRTRAGEVASAGRRRAPRRRSTTAGGRTGARGRAARGRTATVTLKISVASASPNFATPPSPSSPSSRETTRLRTLSAISCPGRFSDTRWSNATRSHPRKDTVPSLATFRPSTSRRTSSLRSAPRLGLSFKTSVTSTPVSSEHMPR